MSLFSLFYVRVPVSGRFLHPQKSATEQLTSERRAADPAFSQRARLHGYTPDPLVPIGAGV